MKNERDRLAELTEELENVRTGRRVRRRATALAAMVVIAGGALTITQLQRNAAPTQTPTIVIAPPEAPVIEAPVDAAPAYAWLERVSTETGELTSVEVHEPVSRCEIVRTKSVLASVTIVDDRAFAEAVTEASPGTGVARVNGRVILTGALAHREEPSENTQRSPQIGL